MSTLRQFPKRIGPDEHCLVSIFFTPLFVVISIFINIYLNFKNKIVCAGSNQVPFQVTGIDEVLLPSSEEDPERQSSIVGERNGTQTAGFTLEDTSMLPAVGNVHRVDRSATPRNNAVYCVW